MNAYQFDERVLERKFYVVDNETFKKPIVVIPNMGTKKDFIMMESRDGWPGDFIHWLMANHAIDDAKMEPNE